MRRARTIALMLLATGLGGWFATAGLLIATPAQAAPKVKAKTAGAAGGSLLPEVVGAKAFLEDLLSRRYSQELATIVDRGQFSLGAELDLAERAKPKEPDADAAPETPPDLVLGQLDPEALLKKYGGDEAAASWGDGILRGYVIKAVSVSVGVREELGPDAKAQVEKWLTDRLKSEFGAAGKGSVAVIRAPIEKTVSPKTPLDWLNQFQALAGQLVFALALILGILLWKVLTSKSSSASKVEQEGGGAAAGAAAVTGAVQAGEEKKEEPEKPDEEEARFRREEIIRVEAGKELRQFTKRIAAIMPRLGGEIESIIRSWCQSGEEGKAKLACLVDAIGESKLAGRLPIPVDATDDLAKVFARMPDLEDAEKLSIVKKAYWDLLMAANLGAETLEQPFGYLGDLNASLVDGILVNQNAKMKAIVALYMPPELREKYLRSIDVNAKRELLEVAAQLDEVALDEVRTFDGELKNSLGGGESRQKTVPMRPLLGKLIEPLTPTEQVTLLAGMAGGSIEEYKRANPSLAFVGFWPDDKLSILLSRAQSDELVALLRVRPELQERLLQLAPPMTAEVAQDELSREDSAPEAERDRLLAQLGERLRDMVLNQEVDLARLFDQPAEQAPGGSGDAGQAA